MSVESLLEIWKADRAFVRVDERNPICPGCNRREMQHLLEHLVNGVLVCAECADDHLEATTGSRW